MDACRGDLNDYHLRNRAVPMKLSSKDTKEFSNISIIVNISDTYVALGKTRDHKNA